MKICLIAGEASGDRLGADLMGAIAALHPDVEFCGIGGRQMQEAGLKPVFDASELSVMGIMEVIKEYSRLKERLNETVQFILDAAPDMVIGIDSPDFNTRIYKAIRRKFNGKIVHYVAPTVWAWRPRRVFKYRKLVDLMLALFPFEAPLWEKVNVPCRFVGHPIAHTRRYSGDEIAAFARKFAIDAEKIALILPGSRKSEVARHQSAMFELVPDLNAAGFGVVTLAADAVIEDVTPPAGVHKLSNLSPNEREMLYQWAEFAVAASGTVSLELAAANTPMVIGYTMSPLTWWIKKALVKIDTVTLVNIIWGDKVVPECLGPNFSAENLRAALKRVISAPDKQTHAFEYVLGKLGKHSKPAHEEAAYALLSLMSAVDPQS